MALIWQHMTYKAGILGQTDTVYGLWSEFMVKFVCAGLNRIIYLSQGVASLPH